ncbi:hypothetical protein [Haloechinothrix sp. LS1_15]|uniref:hypothetical protein n=1 Tax=Haloechinothrix sp. LS1_15 TaxID=2652248 RepID=UPI0029480B6E|nr:hypothetical protein [Haloechinothrix sp. LS1_15]MDV6013755.1 hypothetical protein [Haloechinothrix sp. LS1_15]
MTDRAGGDTPSPTPRPRSEPEETRHRRFSPAAVAMVAVCLGLLAVTGTFGYLWWGQHRAEAQRAEALDVAETFAEEFTTYHYTELDENFERITAGLTDRYAEVYGDTYESFAELLEENQADSEGEVTYAGVAEFSGDTAVVLAFVDQTTTNVNTPQPRIDRNRMVLTMVQSEGEWKVDQVELS